MVGICMTAISIMRFIPGAGEWLDNLIAFDSLIFMGSALLSYFSMRVTGNTERMERYADSLFVLGMVIMVVANFLLAFDLYKH
jgi:hypothetical protein